MNRLPLGKTASEPETLNALRIYTDFWLAKEFGWTPKQIGELPTDYYDDFLHLINLNTEVQLSILHRKEIKPHG